jgi:hypothetical protein
MDSTRLRSSAVQGRGIRSWTPPLLAELQSLLPQYRLLELIGRGDRSAVYRAVQLTRDRNVAIKVLPSELVTGNDSEFVDHLRRVAKLLSGLSHPGIGGVFEQGEVGLLFYLVLELIDGTDLDRHLRVHGAFSQSESVDIAIQICDALEVAHERGVVHRDLRPGNLLRENSGRVKIVDFGLARGAGGSSAGRDIGDFAAPETAAEEGVVDGRADLYSLGVILYQLLTGEVPRGPWIPPSQKSDVDPRFDSIIDRATRPNPAERYATAAEFRRDLKAIEKNPLAGFRRRRWGRILAVAAGILALVTGTTLLWRGRDVSTDSATRSVPELGPGAVTGVEIPNGAAAVGPDESTVEFWALPTSAGWGSLLSVGGGAGGGGALGALSAMAGLLDPGAGIPSLNGLVANSAGRLMAPRLPVNPGSWMHLAFVASRARDETRLYTNGALFASKPGVSRRANSTNDSQSLWIGRSVSGSMRGSITDVRVWNRARSEEEIRADYRRELKGTEPGLALYLPLKEGRGATATNRAAATGPGYDGTLHGNPTWRTKPAPGRSAPAALARGVGTESDSSATNAGRAGSQSRRPDAGLFASNGQSTLGGIRGGGGSNAPGRRTDQARGSVDRVESNHFKGISAAVLGTLAARARAVEGIPSTNATTSNSPARVDTVLGELALHAAASRARSNAAPAELVPGFQVAIGHAALQTNGSGTNLVAVGSGALRGVRRGGESTAVGNEALAAAASSDRNTALGSRALATLQGGSGTLSVGAHAGDGIRRGRDNLYLGTAALPEATAEDQVIRIGIPGGPHQALYLGGVTSSRSGDAELLGTRQDGQVLRLHDWNRLPGGVPLLVDDAGHLGRAPAGNASPATEGGASYPRGSYALLLEGAAPPAGFHRLGVVEADQLGVFTPARPGAAPLRLALFVKD